MIKFLLGVAVLVAAFAYWLIARTPTLPARYTLGKLPLLEALLRLRRRGTGYVMVDGGDHFLQFCLMPYSDEIVIDMPTPQFVKNGRVPNVEVLFALGFTTRETGACNTFEKRVITASKACFDAQEVFDGIFNWPWNKEVKLIEEKT